MVLERGDGGIKHRHFYDLPEFLLPGDCLVINNSRVMPARLPGKRESGGAAEVLLLADLGNDRWDCLVKPGRSLRIGARVFFAGGKLAGTVEREGEGGKRVVRFEYDGIWSELLDQAGVMPLPPYIKGKPSDPSRYQTVYAKTPGSAAAPTAGLHFTGELMKKLRDMDISIAEVTLHIGLGTFQPVMEEDVRDHVMHTEWYEISQDAADTINSSRAAGGRVIAVGTTSCRTLESSVSQNGALLPGSGETGIFITPGYKFRMTDALITNFHLPQSTLLMLVSAFYSKEGMLAAYEEAVRERYRFFSFGDAMLIL
jgi:S-adenosylmethionine:tRNA ribosyltransferase-isomerase